MTKRTWVLLGGTSLITEQFAHIAAQNKHAVLLVGREQEQLNIIAQDIHLRFNTPCSLLVCDVAHNIEILLTKLASIAGEYDLFIAHSDFSTNDMLTAETITSLIKTNILSTVVLINHYLNTQQKEHRIIYLSSVAACRGRAKNSLYGGSKAAVELFLQGLQQAASPAQHITIAKLGFIDTQQTYGAPGIFYAAPPSACAQACWQAMQQNKRQFYFPKFWQFIMTIINCLPFFIYKRMNV